MSYTIICPLNCVFLNPSPLAVVDDWQNPGPPVGPPRVALVFDRDGDVDSIIAHEPAGRELLLATAQALLAKIAEAIRSGASVIKINEDTPGVFTVETSHEGVIASRGSVE